MVRKSFVFLLKSWFLVMAIDTLMDKLRNPNPDISSQPNLTQVIENVNSQPKS